MMKMMKMGKRLLGLLLAVTLMIGLVPGVVSAEESLPSGVSYRGHSSSLGGSAEEYNINMATLMGGTFEDNVEGTLTVTMSAASEFQAVAAHTDSWNWGSTITSTSDGTNHTMTYSWDTTFTVETVILQVTDLSGEIDDKLSGVTISDVSFTKSTEQFPNGMKWEYEVKNDNGTYDARYYIDWTAVDNTAFSTESNVKVTVVIELEAYTAFEMYLQGGIGDDTDTERTNEWNWIGSKSVSESPYSMIFTWTGVLDAQCKGAHLTVDDLNGNYEDSLSGVTIKSIKVIPAETLPSGVTWNAGRLIGNQTPAEEYKITYTDIDSQFTTGMERTVIIEMEADSAFSAALSGNGWNWFGTKTSTLDETTNKHKLTYVETYSSDANEEYLQIQDLSLPSGDGLSDVRIQTVSIETSVNETTQSATLTDKIGFNYYVPFSNGFVNNSKMEFAIGGQTIRVDGTYDSAAKAIKFTCPVSFYQMADTIAAKLYVNEMAVKEFDDNSVKTYANSLIGDTENKYAEEEKALAKAMLNYGAYGQTYMNHNTGNLANDGNETEVTNVVASTLVNYKEDVTTYDSVEAFLGSFTLSRNVVLSDGAKLGFKIRQSGETSLEGSGYTVAVTDGNSANVNVDAAESTGTYTVYRVDTLVQDWDAKATLTITSGESDVLTMKYGIMSYAYNMIKKWEESDSNVDAKLVNLLKSMYLYNKAANEYVTSLTQ